MFKFTEINGNDLVKINEMRDQRPPQLLHSLDAEGGGAPHLVMPHEAYSVDISSLQATSAPKPEPVGLRVIDANGAGFKSIFDLTAAGDAEKEPQKHTDADFLKNYQNAFAKMFGSNIESKNYEVRSLKISALHVDAIWLHKDSHDLYIPVQSMGLFNDDEIYNKTDFFNTLKDAAKKYDFNNDEIGG